MTTIQQPSGERTSAGATHSHASLTVPQAISPLRDGARILVVEDDDLSRRIITSELSKHFTNTEFLEAGGGREVTEILSSERGKVDCMVLDFCLGSKPDEIHGEGVLAWLGENRMVCPTVVRSGSWSNPETVEAREQISENVIRSIYSGEHAEKELRQLTAVPGLPVLVDFMGKGDNFGVLAARLDMVRLHSGRGGEKLGLGLTPVEGVVGAIIHDILGGLDVGRRETTPSRFNISRLDGSAQDFLVYFNRFIEAAKTHPEYGGEGFNRLRSLAQTVEQETREKRFSFEALLESVGSSHPNAHALLNRLLLCRDVVRGVRDGSSPLTPAAQEVSPMLDELYDNALRQYRGSRRRVAGPMNVDSLMAETVAEVGAVQGLPLEFRAPWEPVGSSPVDPELLKQAATELATNACKAAKKVTDNDPAVNIVGAVMSFTSIPPNAQQFFASKGLEKGKFIMLVFENNGERMSDEMVEALNRGDTSILGESTTDTAGTGLRDLMDCVLPEMPGTMFFEKNPNHPLQTVQLFIPKSAQTKIKPEPEPHLARRIQEHASDSQKTPAIRVEEPPKQASGKPRVIIVDDFREFAEMLEECIGEALGDSVETVVCVSPDEFDSAATQPFDAVVSDYVLEEAHLSAAVEGETEGKSRTGRYVCERARELNPKALTIIYSIDNVIDPKSPEAAGADPHHNAPADPQFVNYGLNKSNDEITRSDGTKFERISGPDLGLDEGTTCMYVATHLVTQKIRNLEQN
ncbi:MAG: response regulator [Methanobacteriota archaeon]